MTDQDLRDLIRGYAADEPPLRLQASDVTGNETTGRSARHARRWVPLAAAASVAALALGIAAVRPGLQVTAGGPTGAPAVVSSLAAPSPFPTPRLTSAVGSSSEFAAVLRELGRTAYPGGRPGMLTASNWSNDPQFSLNAGDEFDTHWQLDVLPDPDGDNHQQPGIMIVAEIRAPDDPFSRVLACDPGRTLDLCRVGTLPDGRAYREVYVDVVSWSERPAATQTVATHTVVVTDGDLRIVVEERALGPLASAQFLLPTERLLALAADPRLVPPRPSSLPPLPSHYACAAAPTQPGCPTSRTGSDGGTGVSGSVVTR